MSTTLVSIFLATSLMVAALSTWSPVTAASESGRTNGSAMRGAVLDSYVEKLMARENVKGFALALIEDDQITHLKSYGYRNVEQSLPLETDTIMYGASLTKAAFSYMVLQLVDEGAIELDQSIADLLPKPLPQYPDWASLEGDDEWRLLTPRIILSHSSGLHNLRVFEPDGDLKFHFTPGSEYAYSGEGFYLLQTVLEEGLGLNVKAEMQRRIFDRFNMPDTDMQWRPEWVGKLADGYAMDNSYEPHDERSYVSASGSMDTTIADQAAMWQGMMAGKGLSREMRTEWTRSQLGIKTAQKFPTVELHSTRDQRGPEIRLSAGLGVDTWQGPDGRAFAKGGHNDWTGNLAICQEEQNRCIVMLANSVRAEIIFPEIIEAVFGDVGYPWWWTYPNLHGTPIELPVK